MWRTRLRHTTPLWSRAESADLDTLRLILIAAAQLAWSRRPVQLAMGFPLSWFGPQRKAFCEALTGYGGVVQWLGQTVV